MPGGNSTARPYNRPTREASTRQTARVSASRAMQNKKEDALSKGDTSGAKSISDMQKKLMHSSDARSDQSTLDTSRSRSRQRESAKAATDALKPSTRAIANQPSRNVYNGSRANMGYGGRRRVAMNKGGLARATQGYMCGGMAHKGKKK